MKRQWFRLGSERIARRSESKPVTRRYNDYSITIVAIRDENTGIYSPLAQITWMAREGKQVTRSLTLTDQCSAPRRLASWHYARKKHGPIDGLVVRTSRRNLNDSHAS